jgi:hypothetical protein
MPAAHCRSHPQSVVSLAKVVVSEIERDRSFKVFEFLAESVGQASKTAAMHPESVILLFNVAGSDAIHVRQHLAIHSPKRYTYFITNQMDAASLGLAIRDCKKRGFTL